MWVIRLKGTDKYYSSTDAFSYGALSEAVCFSDTEKTATPLNEVEVWEAVEPKGSHRKI
jgi:hypothetical protein